MDDIELPMFDFNTLAMATNNFSEANKLGQGGFGIVYRVGLFVIAPIITHIENHILIRVLVWLAGKVDGGP